MKLPFVVEPKAVETVLVGNEAIGTINIPKLKDITPVERRFLKAQNPIDIRKIAVKLASDIASTTGQRLTVVYEALTTGDSEALSDFLSELITFQGMVEEADEQRLLMLATAILRFRVMRHEDWTLEDTINTDLIHPDLVKEIALFAQKEESGWVEAAPTEPLTDEALGNS
jgi:hypothetical protein